MSPSPPLIARLVEAADRWQEQPGRKARRKTGTGRDLADAIESIVMDAMNQGDPSPDYIDLPDGRRVVLSVHAEVPPRPSAEEWVELAQWCQDQDVDGSDPQAVRSAVRRALEEGDAIPGFITFRQEVKVERGRVDSNHRPVD